MSLLGKKKKKTVSIATRLHLGEASTKEPDLEALKAFVAACAGFDVAVAVGVPSGSLEDVAALAAKVKGSNVAAEVVPVHPWGKFVPALNALLSRAAGHDYVLFASLEVAPTKGAVETLAAVLEDNPDAVVAGAALPGHDFREGENPLTGVTTPWNTFALWRVEALALTGFPLVADGLAPGVAGGVEEVSAIDVLHRIIHPGNPRKALLVKLPSITWDTSSFDDDPKRKAWHDRKMTSKVDRAEAHLALLRPQEQRRQGHPPAEGSSYVDPPGPIPAPVVLHVVALTQRPSSG